MANGIYLLLLLIFNADVMPLFLSSLSILSAPIMLRKKKTKGDMVSIFEETWCIIEWGKTANLN